MLLQLYDNAHSDSINSVAFHSSGRYLLTGSSDSTMKIFDLRKGSLLYSLYGHEGIVQAVNFSKDGTLFATGGTDCNLILWDSNLIDPEQEAEISKLKKVKNDSKNMGKRSQFGATTAASKLRKIQKKRLQSTIDKEKLIDKENDSGASNDATSKYEHLAENLAGMMDKIAAQLDIITRTVVTLEKRIGNNEDLVNDAYLAFKQHQRNAEVRETLALREKELRADEKHEEEESQHEEQKQPFDPSKSVNDLEETRQKVKNIMNIINISQYSLAAVQKSASEIHETTSKLQKDLSPQRDTAIREPIDEESEDDFDRDI